MTDHEDQHTAPATHTVRDAAILAVGVVVAAAWVAGMVGLAVVVWALHSFSTSWQF